MVVDLNGWKSYFEDLESIEKFKAYAKIKKKA